MEPTRITANSSTLIDHILVSDDSLVPKSGVDDLQCFGSSFGIHYRQHCCSQFRFLYTYVSLFSFFFHSTAFDADLGLVPWHLIYALQNIDDKIDHLNYFLKYIFDLHAPLVTRNFTRPDEPWITPNIRHMMLLRNRARNRFERIREDPERDNERGGAWDYYKDLRNQVTYSIRREKRAFFEYITTRNQGNIKSLWKEINKLKIRDNSFRPLPP